MAHESGLTTHKFPGQHDVLLALTERAGAHIAYLDASLTYVMASPAYASLFGRSPADLAGQKHVDVHPATLGMLRRALTAEPPDRQLVAALELAARPYGRSTYWDWTLVPVLDESGDRRGLVLSLTDVTALVEARQDIAALTDATARHAGELDTVFAAAVNGIIVYDTQGRIIRLNEAARRILGYSSEQMQRPMTERLAAAHLLQTDGTPIALEDFASSRALKGETVLSQVLGLTFSPRPPIWLSFSGAPIIAPDGAIAGAVLTFSDVRDLLETQEQLARALTNEREQNERLAALGRELAAEHERLLVTLRSIGDGVIATDANARITLMNRAAEAMTGWSQEQALGRPLAEVFVICSEATGERLADPVARVLETGTAEAMANHAMLVSRDGRRYMLADSAAPIVAEGSQPSGVVLVFQDVTERRHLEEERAKVNKLESLGILAGGIAHDFNNLLTGVLGNIALARMDVADRPEVNEVLADAEGSAERAKALTQQLLTFAKGGMPVRKATDLSRLLTDVAGAAPRGRRTTLRLDLAASIWPVNVDEGQIGQVVRNLVANADEAMPAGGGITIRAGNATVPEGDRLPLAPGRYVFFSVEDEGPGIPRRIRDRIFDPYFTTKPGGSGIGLSVVYSVVAKHGGCVDVESEPGHGTAIRVYLPAVSVADGAKEAARQSDQPRRALVMDDEATVRTVAARMLARLGYDVVLATEGRHAAALYAEALAAGNGFDVVLVDVYTPGGVGGAEALALLQRVDPGVRAIVCSGYSTDPLISQYATYGFAAAVSKPYRLQDLVAALDAALAVDSARGAAASPG